MLDLLHEVRFLPIHVINPKAEKESAVKIGEELESLIDTLGGKIVDRVIQKLDRPHGKTYIGRGKVQEVYEKIEKLDVDVVILNAMAKPGQTHNLKSIYQKINPQIEVWDRVDLILQIFDKHARTQEAKLQIELARMRYMGPRIYGMGFVMSRQGGGIGTLGVGETNTELMKRHWRSEIKKVNDQIDKMSKNRETQLSKRRRAGFQTVSIVGYTNAGKSSLFNLLSGKHVLEKDELFATLDSNIGKMYVEGVDNEVLISDTIGFIRNLPTRLITAFKSTLMESIHADILLHVIDVSDPEMETKIEVVMKILVDLGRDERDVVFVFNKIDMIKNLDKKTIENEYSDFSPIFVSVKEKSGIEKIKEEVKKRLTDSGLNLKKLTK